MEKDRFKKLFPHLAKEIENGSQNIELSDESLNTNKEKKNDSRKWAGYNPDHIDFIRRCNTIEQAIDVIDYLVNRSEISSEKAKELKHRLTKDGLRSFGPKKTDNYYYKNRLK